MVTCKFSISETSLNSPIKRTFDEFEPRSILPPGIFKFLFPNADTISTIVTPRAAIWSGSIWIRTARSRPPNTDTLATPFIAVILFDNVLSTYSSKSRASAPRRTISTTDSCNGFNFSTTGCSKESGKSDANASIFVFTSAALSLTFTPKLNSAIT